MTLASDSHPGAAVPAAEQTLDAVLGPTHEAWVAEVRRFLTPAVIPYAPFWDRWSVVRYLADQFGEHYRVESALVEELRAFVGPGETEHLRAGAERVTRLRLALDRLGRRRGTAAEFSAIADEFVRALELWCAEIEIVARRIRREDLPAEGAALVELLEDGLRTIT